MQCLHYYSHPKTHDSPFEDGCDHLESSDGICQEADCPLESEEYNRAVSSCATPGHKGCQQCESCMDWGDQEHHRREEDF